MMILSFKNSNTHEKTMAVDVHRPTPAKLKASSATDVPLHTIINHSQ